MANGSLTQRDFDILFGSDEPAPSSGSLTDDDFSILFGTPTEAEPVQEDEDLLLSRSGVRPIHTLPESASQSAVDLEASKTQSILKQQYGDDRAKSLAEGLSKAKKGVQGQPTVGEKLRDAVPFLGISESARGEDLSPFEYLVDTAYRQPLAGTQVSYKTEEKEQAVKLYGLDTGQPPKLQAREMYDKLIATGASANEAADAAVSAFPHAAFNDEEITDNASYDERTYAWVRRKTLAGPAEGAGLVESPAAALGRFVFTVGPRLIWGTQEELTSYEAVPGEFDEQGLPMPADPEDMNYIAKRAFNKYVRNDELREAIKSERPTGVFDVTDPEWLQRAKDANELPEDYDTWDMVYDFTVGAAADFLANPLTRPKDLKPVEREELSREIARVSGVRAPGREGPTTGSFIGDLASQIVASTYAGDDMMESYSIRLQKAAAGELDTLERDVALGGLVREVMLPGWGGPYSLLAAASKTRRGVTPVEAITSAAKAQKAGRLVEGVMEGTAKAGDGVPLSDSIAAELSYLPPEDDALVYLSRKHAHDYVNEAYQRAARTRDPETSLPLQEPYPIQYLSDDPMDIVVKDVDGYVAQASDEVASLQVGDRGIDMTIPLHRQIAGIAVTLAEPAIVEKYTDYIKGLDLKNLSREEVMDRLNLLNNRFVRTTLEDPRKARQVVDELTARRLAIVLGEQTGMTRGFTQVTDNFAITNKAAKGIRYKEMLAEIDDLVRRAIDDPDAAKEVARRVAIRDPDMAYDILKSGVEEPDPLKLINNLREGSVLNAAKDNPAISFGSVKHFEDGFFDHQFVNSAIPLNRQATGWRNIADLVSLTGEAVTPSLRTVLSGFMRMGGVNAKLSKHGAAMVKGTMDRLKGPLNIPAGIPKAQGQALFAAKRSISVMPDQMQDEVLRQIAAGSSQEEAMRNVQQGIVNGALSEGVSINSMTEFDGKVGGMGVYKSILTKLFPVNVADVDADTLGEAWDAHVGAVFRGLGKEDQISMRSKIGAGDLEVFDELLDGFIAEGRQNETLSPRLNSPLESWKNRNLRKIRSAILGTEEIPQGNLELAKFLTVMDLERQRRIARALDEYAINRLDDIPPMRESDWAKVKKPRTLQDVQNKTSSLTRSTEKAANNGVEFVVRKGPAVEYNILEMGEGGFAKLFPTPAAFKTYMYTRTKDLLLAKANELMPPLISDTLRRAKSGGMQAAKDVHEMLLGSYRAKYAGELVRPLSPEDDRIQTAFHELLVRGDLIRNLERLEESDDILIPLMKDDSIVESLGGLIERYKDAEPDLKLAFESALLRTALSREEITAMSNGSFFGYPKKYKRNLSGLVRQSVETKLLIFDQHIEDALLTQRPTFTSTKTPTERVSYEGNQVYDQAAISIKQVKKLGQTLMTDAPMQHEIDKLLDSGVANNMHTRMEEMMSLPPSSSGFKNLAAEVMLALRYSTTKVVTAANSGLLAGVGPLLKIGYLGNNVYSQVFLNSVTNPGRSLGLLASSARSITKGTVDTLAEVFPGIENKIPTLEDMTPPAIQRLAKWMLRNQGGRTIDGGVVLPSGLTISPDNLRLLAQEAGLAQRSLAHVNLAGDVYREITRHKSKGFKKLVDWIDPTKANVNNKLAQNMDYSFREAVFAQALASGDNFETAAELGRRSVLDYSDMHEIERNYLSRLIPFYSFPRTFTMEMLKAFGRPDAIPAIRRQLVLAQVNHRDTDNYGMYPSYVRNYLLKVDLPTDDLDIQSAYFHGRNPVMEQMNSLMNAFASENSVMQTVTEVALGQRSLFYEPLMNLSSEKRPGESYRLPQNDLLALSQNDVTWDTAKRWFEITEVPQRELRAGQVSVLSPHSDEFGRFQNQMQMTKAGHKRLQWIKLAGLSMGWWSGYSSNAKALKMLGYPAGPELALKGRDINPMFEILGVSTKASALPVDAATAAWRIQMMGGLKELRSMGLNPATGEVE
jgi:hypothetical protein